MSRDYPLIIVQGSGQGDLPLYQFLVDQSVRIFLDNPFFKGGSIEIKHAEEDPHASEDYLLFVTLITADGRRFFLWNSVGSQDYVLQDSSLFE